MIPIVGLLSNNNLLTLFKRVFKHLIRFKSKTCINHEYILYLTSVLFKNLSKINNNNKNY